MKKSTDATSVDDKGTARRSFLKKSAAVGAVGTTGIFAAPAVIGQAPLTIKMQTSWPDSNIWQEFARDYGQRVDEMSGGRLKVDVLPAGAIVGAFQVIDAVSDGVLDAAHSVPVYWYGKDKAASSLFGTGPVFGGSATTMMGWFYEGGGFDFYQRLVQEKLGLNLTGYLGFPMYAQPFGWFKDEVNAVADIEGL